MIIALAVALFILAALQTLSAVLAALEAVFRGPRRYWFAAAWRTVLAGILLAAGLVVLG